MKRFLLIFAATLCYGQSTNLTQASNSIAAAQLEFAQYQADHTFGTQLDSICPTCRASINELLQGKANGSMEGVIICCGPNTVPPTPAGTLLIYITPIPSNGVAQ